MPLIYKNDSCLRSLRAKFKEKPSENALYPAQAAIFFDELPFTD
ncbi:MAG: hypothetical protein Q4G71_04515 [Pseudomonadota bacterium]|nr:hypothetical protein [Pseudomonadota bacterium]